MQEILILNDFSQEAQHAAAYAFGLACQYKKNLVIAHLNHISEPVLSFADCHFPEEQAGTGLSEYLSQLPGCEVFQPEISELDISKLNEQELAQQLHVRGIWMVVQGTNKIRLNLQALLNRSPCPFMLVTPGVELRPLERIAYLADLRYAQIPILNFLLRMHSGTERIILTHICAKGLPELDDDYAMDIFSNGLNRSVSQEHLYLSRLRDRSFDACIDQVIHGMEADLLVCSNHHYHFDQILAGNIASSIPASITIPILVFPH